jgi:hypothetical protein
LVTSARAAASDALQGLRREIAATRRRFEKLIGEERSFRLDLFGGLRRGGPGRSGRPRLAPRGRRTAPRPRRKGPPKAERFFKKLPKSFTLDDVRKLAGRASGVSIAQWVRSNRAKKTANGYQKVA